MRIRGLLLIIGLMLAASTLGASGARAQDAVRVAQAETEPAEKAEEVEKKSTTTTPGIEERVILAGESEAAADFESGDSVAGFDTSDLEALGAQSVADLGKFTPNVEIVTTGATAATFFIRGVGLNDFSANAPGAVAIYHNDVPKNSPALQLGTLFDMEQVNILRGPQGTGAARNASAGAIKLYARRPTGEYGGYLRSSYGNYQYLDFEGAVEAPVYEDILSSRFAFRLSERDGYTKNGCAGAPSLAEREANPSKYPKNTGTVGVTQLKPPYSHCGEAVFSSQTQRPWITGSPTYTGYSEVPDGLPSRVNDLGTWAARGMLRFQPTLDMDWLLGAHGSRRDEYSQLGQSLGLGWDVAGSEVDAGYELPDGTKVTGILGSAMAGGYQAPEVREMWLAANYCRVGVGAKSTDYVPPSTPGCSKVEREAVDAAVYTAVAKELARNLDPDPYRGDYDHVGKTTNDTWGLFLKGDIVLPSGVEVTTVTGYDTYDRLIDTDLDFSPNTLLHIHTKDELWQFTEDLNFSGELSGAGPLRWDVGGFYLMEDLHTLIDNEFFYIANQTGVPRREYTQKLWSAAGYLSLKWDFWDDFTLDGGVRYNWERKTIDYYMERGQPARTPSQTLVERTWEAPTGTVRLTYRFREDTHAFWKYTRGWKGGHYNTTTAKVKALTTAEPETIDAFEAGLRGSWFEGRLGFDLALFYYAYKNYQIFTLMNDYGSSPQFVVLNASDAEIYGAELDITSRPWMGSFLSARFSWLESQFLEYKQRQVFERQTPSGSTTFLTELDYSGNRVLNTPRFKLSLTAEQTLPLGRWGSLTARYDAAWTAKNYFDPTEGVGLPDAQGYYFMPDDTIAQIPFWLHNLRLAYRIPGGNVELAGWVHNLTDQVYKTFAADLSNFGRLVLYFVGEPRTYGMTVSVDF